MHKLSKWGKGGLSPQILLIHKWLCMHICLGLCTGTAFLFYCTIRTHMHYTHTHMHYSHTRTCSHYITTCTHRHTLHYHMHTLHYYMHTHILHSRTHTHTHHTHRRTHTHTFILTYQALGGCSVRLVTLTHLLSYRWPASTHWRSLSAWFQPTRKGCLIFFVSLVIAEQYICELGFTNESVVKIWSAEVFCVAREVLQSQAFFNCFKNIYNGTSDY